MPKSLFWILLLLPVLLWGARLERHYELLASEVTQNPGHIEAKGSVVVYGKGEYFSADRALYDPKAHLLELFGHVLYIRDNDRFTRAHYLRIDLKHHRYTMRSSYLYDLPSAIWMHLRGADAYDDKIKLSKTELSSCDVADPDWKITFSQGYYYNKSEFVSLYNPTFYIKKVPILYLPWFGFPTTKKRRSGLLRPIVGFENGTHLFYQQPIFYAPAKDWDLQFDPQIRLDRGKGLYTTLRFVDTNHSKGYLRAGLFKEQAGYAQAHHLNNRTHSGAELYYERHGLLSDWLHSSGGHDGLLVDLTQLSDVDYLNLRRYNSYSVNKLVTSRINYFFDRGEDYLGLYAKYFIDTEKVNNEDTMQTLPSLQYHRFVTPLLNTHLSYALDYRYQNNYRKVGLRASEHEITLPLTFRVDLLDHLLTLSATENLYYAHIHYKEAGSGIEDANHLSNYHVFALGSDLIKRYDDFIHNMQIQMKYIVPSFDHKRGYYADFIPLNYERESLRIDFNEYFYRLDGFDYLTHRIRQIVYLDQAKERWNDFQNELLYRFSDAFWIQNTLFYAYYKHKISKLQTTIDYHDDRYRARLYHTYQSDAYGSEANFLSLDLYSRLNDRYTVYGGLDYDIHDGFTKEWRIGWDMHKRCWNYTLRYKESITPSLTSEGAESTTRRGIYLILRLYPMGGVSYSYVREQKMEGVL